MIWLGWRQHRLQVLIGAAVLAVTAAFLVPSGLGIASAYRTTAGRLPRHSGPGLR